MKDIMLIIIIVLIMQLDGVSQDCNFRIHGFNQESKVAYLGVRNLIEFDEGIDAVAGLELETTNGTIFFDEFTCSYAPLFLGEAYIEIHQNLNNRKELIGTCVIEVQCLPFTLEIGSNTTYLKDTIVIEKAEFLKNSFAVLSTNTNLSGVAKILEFELVVERENQMILQSKYHNYDEGVDSKLKKDLQIILSNDKIHIKHLRYKYGGEYECEHRNILLLVE